MDDRVIFHVRQGNDLQVGQRVDDGSRAIVHGGGRPQLDPTTGLAAPTIIGNDVTLGAQSVGFRSLLRNGTTVGYKSAVVGRQTQHGQEIDDRVIYANDAVFGRVER
jgi:carbonic anhydrase/acetyltransferase-like protein (isoleucine patch superfamily)